MLIESLELYNFRQFVGPQKISFSCDGDKKVTVVVAESGVGKTTLMQSFQWVLYGKCKYKEILNSDIMSRMIANDHQQAYVTLHVKDDSRTYVVTRSQDFRKKNTRIEAMDSVLKVYCEDDAGNSKQFLGREARDVVKNLMHEDLFPYFFLEGERLTRIGQQISKGKNGSNREFTNAIRGLLGFDFLYEAQGHLKKISREYNDMISGDTSSEALCENMEEIKRNQAEILRNEEMLQNISGEEASYSALREELSGKLIGIAEVEEKQRRCKDLEYEINGLKEKIPELQRQVFKKFSSKGFYLVLNALVERVESVLDSADKLGGGIPGMNATAIKHLLNAHKCVCGEDLIEGTDRWNNLKDLMSRLQSNNIGFEIKRFKGDYLKAVVAESDAFVEDFRNLEKTLNEYISSFDRKRDDIDRLNKEIGDASEGVDNLKKQEKSYEEKLISLGAEKRRILSQDEELKRITEGLQGKQIDLKRLDEKIRFWQRCYDESESLRNRILKYCVKKEEGKRIALAEKINEIFRGFYEEDIVFSLSANYDVQIATSNKELSDDFTSGGQDVAVALAFIGAIIKLNGERPQSGRGEMDDEREVKPHSLVLDAPTSNFGMKQMESFSEIMPKITDQIIVFINDKDGPILIDKMSDAIGSRWRMVKKDSYHSVVERGL